MLKKYFIYFVVFAFSYNLFIPRAFAEVCIKDSDAIDIITLLDASERDLSLLGSCEQLVKDLYKQLEDRDTKIQTITQQLIEAKQDIIEYEASVKMWRKVAWYTTGAGIAITILYLLPKFL